MRLVCWVVACASLSMTLVKVSILCPLLPPLLSQFFAQIANSTCEGIKFSFQAALVISHLLCDVTESLGQLKVHLPLLLLLQALDPEHRLFQASKQHLIGCSSRGLSVQTGYHPPYGLLGWTH